MKLPKAKTILDLNLKEGVNSMPGDCYDAVEIASHAISRIISMRSEGIAQAIIPLPGECPIPDFSPSADRKELLRKRPLGRECG